MSKFLSWSLPSRRSRLAFSSLLALVLALDPNTAFAETPRSPNIVLIVADDLGWASVGYHEPGMKTPHIDRLAAEGQTPLFMAVDGEPAGLITVADPIKPTSAEAVARLHRLGVETAP